MRIAVPTILGTMAFAMPVMAETAPFRFENYTERTAFTAAVTTRFPVGSSYLEFKRQVIGAGAKAEQNILTNPSNVYVYKKNELPGVTSMILHNWTITVTAQNDTIAAISPTVVVGSNSESVE